jgi:hypothetical protein
MTTPLRAFLVGAFVLAGCDDGPPSFGDPLDDPQVPPRGSEDVVTWIEAGHYQSWACEASAHPPRGNGAHGTNRICSNDAIATSSGSGPFPVGAAAVKELLDSRGAISQYAVYLKIEEGEGGDTWYWFEGKRGDVPFNGIGESTCTNCHRGAPRDFVFTVVTR